MILCRTRVAADRVKYKITKYLQKELRLSVNERKSQVAPLWKCSFLGFTFDRIRWRGRWKGLAVQVALSDKTLERIKRKVRDLTGRSQGIAWRRRLEDLNRVLRGWVNYFGLIAVSTPLVELDEWIRRRLRMGLWKQWKLAKSRVRELLARGVPRVRALETGYSQKGYWRLAKTPAVQAALGNAWFRKEGLVSLEASWKELADLRRTAGCETRTSGGVGAGG